MESIKDTIPGWFDEINRNIFACFLTKQSMSSIFGHIGEIGVYKGKSTIELAKHVLDFEDLFLIDYGIADHELEVMHNITEYVGRVLTNIHFFSILSERFPMTPEYKKYYAETRFFHVDGGHQGEIVMRDMDIAYQCMQSRGIVVVDDFFQVQYPQITEAVFRYLFEHPYRLKLFLTCTNKAYFCRPDAYSFYYEYCLKDLQNDMLQRGLPITIMKTSGVGDSSIISARIFDRADPYPFPNEWIVGIDADATKLDMVERRDRATFQHKNLQ